mgnify:CR=1 FL=1
MMKQKDEKNMWQRLGDIDVRIMWALAIICLVIPFLSPLGTPVIVTEPTKGFAKIIEDLPNGSVVVVQGSVSVAFLGEVFPAMIDTFRYLMSKDLKIVIVSFAEDGPITVGKALDVVKPEALGKKYGRDWVWFGYIAGLEVGMASFAKDLRMLANDFHGTPIKDIPLMQEVKNYEDVDLVIDFNVFLDMCEYSVRQWAVTYKKPLLIATMSSNIPVVISYYQAKQVLGYLNGVRGAAEYEAITGVKGLGMSYSDATAFVVLATIAFMAIGNLSLIGKSERRFK